jgi:hypothetical protein
VPSPRKGAPFGDRRLETESSPRKPTARRHSPVPAALTTQNPAGHTCETNLILDDDELAALNILHPTISVEDSIRVALEARLDFQNQQEQFADAQRQVKLAADSLKTQVDLAAAGSISSPPDESSGFPVPDPERYRWNAGCS